MKWYYKVIGGHTHVRVFMNGGKCGDLVFRNEEFLQIRAHFHDLQIEYHPLIHFVDDDISEAFAV